MCLNSGSKMYCDLLNAQQKFRMALLDLVWSRCLYLLAKLEIASLVDAAVAYVVKTFIFKENF